ncbi:MAG: hypothetical protein KJ676_14630 [Alphaproteobacteria bacterium]|nr:hypothetical protein [Alphaproteobacteria bacterium]MBU1526919.1 hypothetical protein [Alphaproteobacteria bacterium]MBU2352509.1 hypothetical protein [Alphaproteobacteria bacterium]MBU2382011.1 hypothetical protein [Alphaproteobacteria bacterium]
MRRPGTSSRQGSGAGRWSAALAVAVGLQAAMILGLSMRTPDAPPPEPPVTLIELMPPEPPPPPPAPAPAPEPDAEPAADVQAVESSDAAPAPEPARAPSPAPRPPVAARKTPRPPPEVPTRPAEPSVPDLPLIGGARLTGALRAGGGGSGEDAGGGGPGGDGAGGSCDMIGRLERALRDDAELRRAVAATLTARNAAGQAVLVWDGDWLQSPGQSGKGLAGIRQAVAVEVGFAPRACKDEQVRGLAVVALDGTANGPKVALGTGTWRWRDLLGID